MYSPFRARVAGFVVVVECWVGGEPPFMARAVRAITGMSCVAASRLSIAVASSPSIPGSWMSIRISRG